MKTEHIGELIESLDFITFRELAKHCIDLRGFVSPTVSDGWSDGGRDIRVYHPDRTHPLPVAFQTTIEKKDWKSKVLEDVEKAKQRLGCNTFYYVTNRRIGDAEFAPLVTKSLAAYEVNLYKIDKQDLAQQIVDDDQIRWLLVDLLGFDISAPHPQRGSLRQEVADTFILLSSDVHQFRTAVIEHAIRVALYRLGSLSLVELVVNAQSTIDMSTPEMFRSAIDRLRQRGELVQTGDMLCISDTVRQRYSDAELLVQQDWAEFVKNVKSVLGRFIPKRSARVTLDEASQAVSERIGSVVHVYRDYQAAILQFADDQKDIRRRYLRETASVSVMIQQFGVPEDKISECMRLLCELEKQHFSVAKMTAGEVFRRLTSSGNSALLNALGGVTGISIYVEPSVMIPMICTRLYRQATGNRFLNGANSLFESAAGLSVKFVLPDVWLEECATHLVVAGRYEPIVASQDVKELLYSENAFVAYYAALGKGHVEYVQFLQAFGYKKSADGFRSDVMAVEAKLRQILDRYGVERANVRQFHGHPLIRKAAEQDLDHIYHDDEITKPPVLVRHDAAMLAFVRERSMELAEALVVATWDKSLQEACRLDDYQWWCLDPNHASDILSLANPENRGSMDVEVALMMDDEQLSRAASALSQLNIGVAKDGVFEEPPPSQGGSYEQEVYCAAHG